MKEKFIKNTLGMGFVDKEQMDESYLDIIRNTRKVNISKDIVIVDTSNVMTSRNLELTDLLEGEAKEAYERDTAGEINYEQVDYTFLMPEYKPIQGSDSDVCDYTNSTTCLSAIIPDDQDEAREKFAEINFLTTEKAVEILEESGYHHLPLDRNAASGLLASKVGNGKSINSILDIPDGRLKRELSVISTTLSGANVENNDGGFFKVVYGQGAAYLTNYKDLHGDVATNMLMKHFEELGYDDITFDSGYLEKYYYSAIFSSKKLGKAVLEETGIKGKNAVAKIYFKTSDYGLSSVNMTPTLQFDIGVGKMGALRRVEIVLSNMVNLNHSASVNETEGISMRTLWKDKCEEIFAVVKENSDKLGKADKIVINYPRNAMNNLLIAIGVTGKFPGKEEIVEEYMEDFEDDCTARDLYIYAFNVISEWEKTNTTSSLRAKERLVRVLLNNTWAKYDTAK